MACNNSVSKLNVLTTHQRFLQFVSFLCTAVVHFQHMFDKMTVNERLSHVPFVPHRVQCYDTFIVVLVQDM